MIESKRHTTADPLTCEGLRHLFHAELSLPHLSQRERETSSLSRLTIPFRGCSEPAYRNRMTLFHAHRAPKSSGMFDRPFDEILSSHPNSSSTA